MNYYVALNGTQISLCLVQNLIEMLMSLSTKSAVDVDQHKGSRASS
jgi:hypothetical protein